MKIYKLYPNQHQPPSNHSKQQHNHASMSDSNINSNTNNNNSQTTTSTFLSHIKGKNVSVKLNSGLFYKGLLVSIDGFMNVSLRDATEYHETEKNGLLTTYNDDIFLRGNQVNYIGEA